MFQTQVGFGFPSIIQSGIIESLRFCRVDSDPTNSATVHGKRVNELTCAHISQTARPMTTVLLAALLGSFPYHPLNTQILGRKERRLEEKGGIDTCKLLPAD